MVQMVGVLVLALGLPEMFDSAVHGDHVDNQLMVVGYVIMRVPMLFQWCGPAREDPARRAGLHEVMVVTLLVAQVGWILLLLADLTTGWMFRVVGRLVLVDRAGRPGASPRHSCTSVRRGTATTSPSATA